MWSSFGSTAQILIYAERLCLLQGAGGPRSCHDFELSQRFAGGRGEARANNADRILTWIGQITSITPFNVTFRAFGIQSHSWFSEVLTECWNHHIIQSTVSSITSARARSSGLQQVWL